MNRFWKEQVSRSLQMARGADWKLICIVVALTQNSFFSLKPIVVAGALVLYGVRATPPARLRLHWFYFSLAALALLEVCFNVRIFSAAYLTVAGYAVGLWLLMGGTFLFLRTAVYAKAKIFSANVSLKIYFLIAVLFTLVNLLGVIADAGVLNPYDQAAEPLFGVSSGDHLSGLYGFQLWTPRLGDFSSTNSAIMALLTLWFFACRQWKWALLAGIILLFTGSNLINLFLISTLIVYAAYRRQQVFWVGSVLAAGTGFVFYAFVMPGSLTYLSSQFKTSQRTDTLTSQNSPSKILNPEKTVPARQYSKNPFNPDVRRGKITSFVQTKKFLGSTVKNAVWGAGPGRFSSMIAVLAAPDTGKSKGRFFSPLHYEAPLFSANHRAISQIIKSLPPEYHSITQSPASGYNLLLGEYGAIGFCVFLFLYVYRILTHAPPEGKILVLLFLLLLLADYFFEALCLVPVFEWLVLLSFQTPEDILPD